MESPKDNYVFFNDEWNGIWVKDSPREVEIKELSRVNGPWINVEHFWFEQMFKGVITKEEYNLKIKNKNDSKHTK